jgi:hypothetical protein
MPTWQRRSGRREKNASTPGCGISRRCGRSFPIETTWTSQLKCPAVEEFPTAKGPADYALFVNGRLLGIVEAKKVGVGPQNVLEQAKRYSMGAFTGQGNWNGYRVPFLYATNGETIWQGVAFADFDCFDFPVVYQFT